MAHDAAYQVFDFQKQPIRKIDADGTWIVAYNADEGSDEEGDETEIVIKGLTPGIVINALWAEVAVGTISPRDIVGRQVATAQQAATDAREALMHHMAGRYLARTHTDPGHVCIDAAGHRQRDLGAEELLIDMYMAVHGLTDREEAAERLGDLLVDIRANQD